MSEVQELQEEEREALISIYEGDAAFKQVNPTTYSYKVKIVGAHNLLRQFKFFFFLNPNDKLLCSTCSKYCRYACLWGYALQNFFFELLSRPQFFFTSNFYLFQYGEDEDKRSFLLELCWGDQYPNELPTINVDMFYNRNM